MSCEFLLIKGGKGNDRLALKILSVDCWLNSKGQTLEGEREKKEMGKDGGGD